MHVDYMRRLHAPCILSHACTLHAHAYHMLPVGICGLPWHLLVTNRTEVMIVTMVDKGHVCPLQSLLESFQPHASLHTNRPLAAHWFVQEIGLPTPSEMITQLFKPSRVLSRNSFISKRLNRGKLIRQKKAGMGFYYSGSSMNIIIFNE